LGFKESDIKKIWETLIEVDDMDLGTKEKAEIIKDFLKGEMKYNLEDIFKLDRALNSPSYYNGREPAYLIREVKKKGY
jgi:hypothetical protein